MYSSINLGVFDENPSTTQGAIGIYKNLMKYVPDVGGVPYVTLVFGDQLSCERGNSALEARSNEETPRQRLEALQPAGQEFHKEMLLLQDFYDEFLGQGSKSKGTLSNARNFLNFRDVTKDISQCVDQAWQLMHIVTCAMVCLLAAEELNMCSASERPDNAPSDFEASSQEDKKQYLEDLSKHIVEKLWHRLDVEALINPTGIPDANLYPYCCGQDIEDDMIGCELREACVHNEWFHYSCRNINPNDIPDVFLCSPECRTLWERQDSGYKYCFCRTDTGAGMVECEAGRKCLHKQWYHLNCVELQEDDLPDIWYCSTLCQKQREGTKRRSKKKRTVGVYTGKKDDHVRAYCSAIAWRGLNLLCRRDAVRENDGPAIIRHWRLDFVSFFNRNHPKYVILAHRLLASIGGWMPEKIRQELVWNRTINYSGGAGRNIPADLMNEIFNKLFKEQIKGSGGQYTEATIARNSKLVGQLGEALDRVFGAGMGEESTYKVRRKDDKSERNVEDLLGILEDQKLFKHITGREFPGFPEYTFTENVKKTERVTAKVKQLSKRLDVRDNVVADL